MFTDTHVCWSTLKRMQLILVTLRKQILDFGHVITALDLICKHSLICMIGYMLCLIMCQRCLHDTDYGDISQDSKILVTVNINLLVLGYGCLDNLLVLC